MAKRRNLARCWFFCAHEERNRPNFERIIVGGIRNAASSGTKWGEAMRKLLVTGAHSTGKSGLASAIVEDMRLAGYSAVLVEDVARSCPFAIGLGQTDRGTMWLLHQQVAAELRAEAGNADWIVCDRGVPDILAHWTEIGLRSGSQSELMERLKAYLTVWAQSYSDVFQSFIDERIPLIADGLREPDPAYRVLMERLVVEELQKLGVSSISLPFGIEDRRAFVRSVLQLHN